MKILSKKDQAIKWGITHKPTVERFRKKQVKLANGCIEFRSFAWDSRDRYRGFNIQPKGDEGTITALVKAHRFAFALHYGFNKLPVGTNLGPKSGVINHVCNNTRCVNPEHLNVLTLTENALYNNTTTRKNCSHCGQSKPFADFYKRSIKEDRHDYYCKKCRNAYTMRNKAANPKSCSISNCPSPHYARKMCRNHYSQYMYAIGADGRKVGRK